MPSQHIRYAQNVSPELRHACLAMDRTERGLAFRHLYTHLSTWEPAYSLSACSPAALGQAGHPWAGA